MKLRATHRYLLLAGIVVVCIASRFLPHPPNFTPIAALALFSGFLLGRKGIAFLVPLLALAVSDLVIGAYDPGTMILVYAGLSFPVVLAFIPRAKLTPLRVGGCAAASSVVFFVTSNVGVWLFSGMYERGLTGLVHCFGAALPFFRYTLCGDLFWATAMFGAYAAITARATRPAFSEPARQPVVV